jgi:hypothetical protein
MSQKNSEILGNKQIALSLLESEYPKLIFVEEPILVEEPIFVEEPILVEEPLIDALTGMANNPTGDVPPVGERSTYLYNAQFSIGISSDMPNHYTVTGSVTVDISEEDMDLLTVYPIFLRSTLRGEDRSPYDNNYYDYNLFSLDKLERPRIDEKLFSFQTQTITAPGIYIFSAIVPRTALDEDKPFGLFESGEDEVYNDFSIVSGTTIFNVKSSTKHGYFG